MPLRAVNSGSDSLKNDTFGVFGAIHGQTEGNIVGGTERLCVVHGYFELTAVQSGRES